MKRWLSWTLRVGIYGFLFLVLLAIGLYWGLKRFYPPSVFREEISAHASRSLNARVSIQSVEINFFPIPNFSLLQTKIYRSPEVLVAEFPQITLFAVPVSLKRKELAVKKVVFVEPQLHLKFPLGKWAVKRATASLPSSGWKITWDSFQIHNGKLHLKDQVKGARLDLLFNGNLVFKQGLGLDLSLHGHSAESLDHFYEVKGLIGAKTRLDGKVTSVPISRLHPYLPLSSCLAGEFDLTGTYEKSRDRDKWSLSGNVSKAYFQTDPEIAKATGSFSLTDTGFQKAQIHVKSTSTLAALQISQSGDGGRRRYTFQLNAEKFNWNEIQSWREFFRSSATAKKDWEAEGKVLVTTGAFRKFHFRDFSSDLFVSSGVWHFSGTTCAAFGGTLQGKFDIHTGKEKKITAAARGSGLKAEEIFGLWHSSVVQGSGQCDLTMAGPLSSAFLKQADGAVVFRIENGTLRNFPTFLRILSVLNLKTVFTEKLGSEAVHRFPFKTLAGNLRFRSGRISGEKMKLDSETLAIEGTGSVFLPEKRIDAKVSVHALSFVDEILKRVPLLNRIYWERKSIIPLWAGVKGPLNDPDIVPFQIPDPEIDKTK